MKNYCPKEMLNNTLVTSNINARDLTEVSGRKQVRPKLNQDGRISNAML
jgi:hypothetical protein